MSAAYPAANDRAPMFRVSLILEALRARPALMFWVAALAQGTLWTLVPSLFYAAPPGEVPLVLAVGREWVLGSPYGPPLAYWLADIAFTLAGGVRRPLRALAALRGRHLLGGVRARPPHRRHRARRDGGPADGRHQRVHGADHRISGRACSRCRSPRSRYCSPTVRWPTIGAATGSRRASRSACCCSPTYAGLILLALMIAVRCRDRARAQPARIDRAVGCRHHRGADRFSAPVLARTFRLQPAADAPRACPVCSLGEKRLMAWVNLVLLLAVQPRRASSC